MDPHEQSMRDRAALQFNVTGDGSDELLAYLKKASIFNLPDEVLEHPKPRQYKKNKDQDVIEYNEAQHPWNVQFAK